MIILWVPSFYDNNEAKRESETWKTWDLKPEILLFCLTLCPEAEWGVALCQSLMGLGFFNQVSYREKNPGRFRSFPGGQMWGTNAFLMSKNVQKQLITLSDGRLLSTFCLKGAVLSHFTSYWIASRFCSLVLWFLWIPCDICDLWLNFWSNSKFYSGNNWRWLCLK